MRETTQKKGYLQVFLAGTLWGTIGLFVTAMSEYGASSALTSFLRIFFAFLILLTITVFKFGWKSFLISKRDLLSCALLGLICQGIYNVFYSYAIVMTGVTISAVLLNVAPVFTALVSYLLFSEKITWIKKAALVMNVVGCSLAATGGHISSDSASFIGILFGVGAGFCYSLTAIIGRIAGSKTNAFVVSTYSYFFAAIFLGIFMKPWDMSFHIKKEVWIIGFLYALIPTAIGYLLYYMGVQKIRESSKVPVIASIETIVASLLGMLVYQEQMKGMNFLGIILVMGSVVLMNQQNMFSRIDSF